MLVPGCRIDVLDLDQAAAVAVLVRHVKAKTEASEATVLVGPARLVLGVRPWWRDCSLSHDLGLALELHLGFVALILMRPFAIAFVLVR